MNGGQSGAVVQLRSSSVDEVIGGADEFTVDFTLPDRPDLDLVGTTTFRFPYRLEDGVVERYVHRDYRQHVDGVDYVPLAIYGAQVEPHIQ
jgi:hypothetical protein